MRLPGSWTAIALLVALAAAPAAAQTGAQTPPMPKPGPEHAILKMDEGTWDAVVEFIPGPGAPPMVSKGVEVNTLGCNGLCLITDFKGEAMGSAFHGHGMATWDPAKKKYTGSWTDSMSTGISVAEMTYDAATKTGTGSMEGPDMTGKVMRTRTVTDYKTEGMRVMTSYAPGPDGKEMQVMKITYTRRK
jgi:hypothetical protein